MSEKKKIVPTAAQRAAMDFKGRDILISAGAGSGKTQTMTDRIVELITKRGENDEEPDDISRKLIVTFTKEAANELKVRISNALSDALSKNPRDKHISEQLVKLGSADICTIDSFCLKLVRSHFEQVGLDGGFRISDESENEVLSQEALTEVLDRFFEEKGDNSDFLRVADCFSTFSGDRKLKKDLLDLYKTLITTKNGLKTLLANPSSSCDFMLTPYGDVLKRHMTSGLSYYITFYDHALTEMLGNKDACSAFEKAFTSDKAFAIELLGLVQNGTYFEISHALSSFKAQKRGDATKVVGVDVNTFIEMRDDFKEFISNSYKKYFCSDANTMRSIFENNTRVCTSIYNILCAFDAEYSRRKRAAGVCDFNDISRYAMELLYDKETGKPTPLADEIRDEYDEIYVDEYQDTNFLQDKIFNAISNNNRFLVGDIKQSIYRFRSAEPEIFSDYRRRFDVLDADSEGFDIKKVDTSSSVIGYSLFMSENFRCEKPIIDFSNAVSNFTFGKSGGIPYQAQDDLRFKKLDPLAEAPSVEVYLVDKAKADKSGDAAKDAPENAENDAKAEMDEEELLLYREADFVADKIQHLINDENVSPSDITILLRGFKKPVELYINALTKRGIATEYRGDEHFFEKSEILLTLCVLNAIDNPLRDTYLAGAMRSDVFGFSLEDLVRIRKNEQDRARKAGTSSASFYNAVVSYSEDDELHTKITEFLAKLKKYRDACRKKTAYDIIAMVYADTGLISMATESERRSLLKLYELARSYEAGKYKGLYGFLRYVEGVKDNSGKEQLGAIDRDSVKLMSVHASKGLQFEFCFVCGCGAKMSSQDSADPIQYHRDLGVSAYVSRDKGIAKFNTLLRRTTALAIKRSYIEEEMRMLYVAMTRARRSLIITAGIANPKDFLQQRQAIAPFATEYSVLNPKNFMDWIVQACALNPSMPEPKIISGDEVVHINGNDNVEEAPAPDRAEVEELKRVLSERLKYEYPHAHLERLPSKMSISLLQPKMLDSEDNREIRPKYGLDDIPPFMSDADSFSAAEHGTATHIFLQFCKFENLKPKSKDDDLFELARAELERLKDSGFISEPMKRLVIVRDIVKLIKSPTFEALLNAKKLWSEFRFNVLLPVEELSGDEKLKNERVLVQGVIDCLYETEDGKLVLMDYKTDTVVEDEDGNPIFLNNNLSGERLETFKRLLAKKHCVQLSYYKRAVEMMFKGRKVDKTVVYSVPLAAEIPIQD